MSMDTKTLTVVIDDDSNECLYIDGKAWESTGETTVFSCDIAIAAGDEPVRVVHKSIDFRHEEWPETLEAALLKPIPDPPEPPAGFVVQDREAYRYTLGDRHVRLGFSRSWARFEGSCHMGLSAIELDAKYPQEAPFYIASPIPKPFSISEHGPGVYETRGGRTAEVTALGNPADKKWQAAWPDASCWWPDNGRCFCDTEVAYDLVRYLRPLPKPAVDPGEGWRLLGDDERPVRGDWHTYGSNPHPGSWIDYYVEYFAGKTVAELRSSHYSGIVFRRRVTPVAQSEWKRTGEQFGVAKFTNGTDTEWRVV
jgi:hypothetical protein